MVNFINRNLGLILWSVIFLTSGASAFFLYDMIGVLAEKESAVTTAPKPPKGRPVEQGPTLRQKKDYELIVRRDIFSFPKGSAKTIKAKVQGRPTTLNIILKATIISPKGLAWAVIQDPTERKEELYGVGDSIQDARIMEIQKEQVVLMRGGQREILKLFVEGAGPGAMGRRPSARAERRAPSIPPQVISSVQESKRLAQQKIRSLMAQLRLRPKFEGGKPQGFEVGHVKEGSLFEAAGLRKGDLIVAINDQDVRSPTQLMKAYREIAEEEEIWLDIVRDGREETIEIDLEGMFSQP
jgi:type II secretion system protein C